MITVFTSGSDLVSKTPAFYHNATTRLDQHLHRAFLYAEKHFGGQNLYIEEMNKNVKHAEAVANDPERDVLRRLPPSTLLPGVRAYPEDLVIR